MYEVCVWSFAVGPLQRLNVQHYQDKISVKALLTAVGQALGIQEDNKHFFAIFEGPLLNPLRKLDENYELHLPFQNSLSIQKWSFDNEKERISLKSDTAALKLLRYQALSYIHEGRLKPSQEEIEALESFNSFMVEHQVIEIIYSLKDYGAVIIENCQVITELTLPQVSLAKREYIILQLNLKGLTLKTSNTVCVISWGRIRKASSSGNIVEYEIHTQFQLIKWLRVETRQADYIKSVTSEIWKVLNKRHHTQDLKSKNTATSNIAQTDYPYHFGNFHKI